MYESERKEKHLERLLTQHVMVTVILNDILDVFLELKVETQVPIVLVQYELNFH